ncbi:MAG: M56 family metallopeptidase, partial [Planctomycetota bacterium]
MSITVEGVISAIGLALLHFLWQGAVLGAVLAVALATMSRRPASDRYLARVLVLAAMAAAPVLTVLVLLVGRDHPAVTPAAAWTTAAPVAVAGPERGLEWLLPWIVAAWGVGALLLLGRLVVGWLGVRRLRRCPGADLPPAWQQIFRDLAQRMGVRATARLVHGAVRVPTALGWLQPLVLLPAELLTGLSEAQIRALLVHELAHVRRADYIVNILQSIVEAVLFYHPAVWIVSRGIRAERECCCDETAVALTGDRLAYARTLADLAAWRLAAGPRLELSTLGGSLMYRIKRLLGDSTPTDSRAVPAAGFLVAAGALIAASVGLAGPPAAACPPDEQKDAAPEAESVSTYELHRLGAVSDEPEDKQTFVFIAEGEARGDGTGCCCCCCSHAHANAGAHGKHAIVVPKGNAGVRWIGTPEGGSDHVIWLDKDGNVPHGGLSKLYELKAQADGEGGIFVVRPRGGEGEVIVELRGLGEHGEVAKKALEKLKAQNVWTERQPKVVKPKLEELKELKGHLKLIKPELDKLKLHLKELDLQDLSELEDLELHFEGMIPDAEDLEIEIKAMIPDIDVEAMLEEVTPHLEMLKEHLHGDGHGEMHFDEAEARKLEEEIRKAMPSREAIERSIREAIPDREALERKIREAMPNREAIEKMIREAVPNLEKHFHGEHGAHGEHGEVHIEVLPELQQLKELQALEEL